MSDSLADTIKPKSDQLNADDLLVAPITVTVTDVKRGPADQPVHVHIAGHQPYKPCKTMRRVLISAWGDNGADWVGKSMTLYCDPTVKFGGVALGGIRISHLTHINGTLSLMLTASRGKKSMFTVKELNVVDPQVNIELTDNDKKWISAAKKNPDIVNTIEDDEYRNYIKSMIK